MVRHRLYQAPRTRLPVRHGWSVGCQHCTGPNQWESLEHHDHHSVYNPVGRVTTTKYDSLDRVVETILPDPDQYETSNGSLAAPRYGYDTMPPDV